MFRLDTDEVTINDIKFRKDQRFGEDTLVTFTDDKEYAVVICRDLYDEYYDDSFVIQVMQREGNSDAYELYQETISIPSHFLKKTVTQIYQDFNNR